MLFITNQGTDAHFSYLQSTNLENSLKPFNVVKISGKVSSVPSVLPGGHVKFEIEANNKNVEVVCFKESGKINKIIRKLRNGDEVIVLGGTREFNNRICINLEKLETLKVAERRVVRAPICPNCNIRCKKKGKRQGYECEKCGFKTEKPEILVERRDLGTGIYLPDPASMRHLAKPLQRYEMKKREKKFDLIEGWLK
jgi:tRNA(Ile2)-agmatinylcytidine synthase